jgi:hypothetical protein
VVCATIDSKHPQPPKNLRVFFCLRYCDSEEDRQECLSYQSLRGALVFYPAARREECRRLAGKKPQHGTAPQSRDGNPLQRSDLPGSRSHGSKDD